jgi:D-arabinose 1-dehydrogenase-like Zn-dependent alcohol dehydrogenase
LRADYNQGAEAGGRLCTGELIRRAGNRVAITKCMRSGSPSASAISLPSKFPSACHAPRHCDGMFRATVMLAAAHASVLTPSAIGTTYRALVAGGVGDSFRSVAKVVELPIPALAEGEVLVKVVYAGVNGGCETFRARGEFAFVGNKDAADGFALGAEGVGVVAAIGDGVENVVVGDAVCFVGSGFAEYTKAKAQMLWKVPQPTGEMAALRISALTACAMIELTGKVRPGETVLVTAAAGGAGHFAVQFAKMAGCTVIGTCSNAEKAKALCALGCDHITI